MRIVSLLPSTSEILFAIGAGDDVVGVTFECDYPAEARKRRIVSTSAMPEGLSSKEIDDFVTAGKVRFLGMSEAAPATVRNDPDDAYGDVPRNAPCPCGSGKKFKRCHGDPKTRTG